MRHKETYTPLSYVTSIMGYGQMMMPLEKMMTMMNCYFATFLVLSGGHRIHEFTITIWVLATNVQICSRTFLLKVVAVKMDMPELWFEQTNANKYGPPSGEMLVHPQRGAGRGTHR